MAITDIRSRFECKYLIEPRLQKDVRAFIEPFMRPDPYASRYPDYTYPICSLYLDSPDLQLYNQVLAGEKNRFKLRVRNYSDDPRTPVFFEVKRRMNLILQKTRAKLDRGSARDLLRREGTRMPSGLASVVLPDLDEFTSYRLLISAKPVVRVKYMREAYESKTGEPIRVTFDTQLKHAVTFDDSLSLSDGHWVETPVDGVILEVKYTEQVPSWARDMARIFGLRQQSVPKYVWSIDRILKGTRAQSVTLAGFALPPLRYRDMMHE